MVTGQTHVKLITGHVENKTQQNKWNKTKHLILFPVVTTTKTSDSKQKTTNDTAKSTEISKKVQTMEEAKTPRVTSETMITEKHDIKSRESTVKAQMTQKATTSMSMGTRDTTEGDLYTSVTDSSFELGKCGYENRNMSFLLKPKSQNVWKSEN